MAKSNLDDESNIYFVFLENIVRSAQDISIISLALKEVRVMVFLTKRCGEQKQRFCPLRATVCFLGSTPEATVFLYSIVSALAENLERISATLLVRTKFR